MKHLAILTCCVGSLISVGLFSSCNKEKIDTPPASPQQINGTVQKGPFITGTSVTIYPLDDMLRPTGESYETQITNDLGNFSLPAKITTPYAELIAQGYYFNEVRDELSEAPITLRSITKLSDGDKNINLLTTLEAERLRHLMTTEHKTFDEARTIAQSEVLASFGITLNENMASDCMDISHNGEGNAALLAISCLLQGYGGEAELSERTAKIANDIRDNGRITNTELLQKIQYNRTQINAEYISQYLRKRYTALGITNVQIPDIYGYLDSDDDGILNGAKPYLLTPTLQQNQQLTYEKDTIEITVHSNVKWVAEIPAEAAEWLSIDGRTTNELLVLIVQANESSPRTAQLKLKEEGGTLTHNLNITQLGKSLQLTVNVSVASSMSKSADPSLKSEVKNLVLIGFSRYGDMLFNRAINELAFDTVNISIETPFLETNPYCRVYAIANDFDTYSRFSGDLETFQALRTYRDVNDLELPLTRTAFSDVLLDYNKINTIDLPLVPRTAKIVFNVKLNAQDFSPEAEIVEFTAKEIRSRSGLLFWLGRDTDPAYTNDLTVTRGTDNQYTFYVYGYTEMKQFEIKVRDNGTTTNYITKFQEFEFRPGMLYPYTATISKAQSGYN
ncbi:BACON domain-containing protein [uncultured Rikenella sp.]|uniref:BACON domain-containing protein n=1 Tax=uncultured Rikenella sp. TaxID=368003 RepID=UPI00262FE206|nr:BACON domain-containing protein [uncultured Rikenella sp.]